MAGAASETRHQSRSRSRQLAPKCRVAVDVVADPYFVNSLSAGIEPLPAPDKPVEGDGDGNLFGTGAECRLPGIPSRGAVEVDDEFFSRGGTVAPDGHVDGREVELHTQVHGRARYGRRQGGRGGLIPSHVRDDPEDQNEPGAGRHQEEDVGSAHGWVASRSVSPPREIGEHIERAATRQQCQADH